MEERIDTLLIKGYGALLDAGYETIARQHGWTPTVKDEEGNDIPNPLSAKDKTLSITVRFWSEMIVAAKSAEAAEQSRLAAMGATSDALSNVTITLETGE